MTGGVVSGAEKAAAAAADAAEMLLPEEDVLDEVEVEVSAASPAAAAPQFPLMLQDRGARPGHVCSTELL